MENAVKVQLGGETELIYTLGLSLRGLVLYAYPIAIILLSSTSLTEKSNLKQYVVHFIETCNNVGTDGDLMIKQFAHTLKGIAFDWYIDKKTESIIS